jgi:rhodanese-related sulfurtransferase
MITKKQITNILSWLFLSGVLFYFAYAKGWIFAGFESISPQQAYTFLHNEENITLLDVRTPDEFSSEHIEGATLIPLQILEQNLPKLANARNQKIIVYCRSGMRSVTASRILSANGFTPLNVKGGIEVWKSEGVKGIITEK